MAKRHPTIIKPFDGGNLQNTPYNNRQIERNKIIVALSLIACTLLSCQKEKERPSSQTNESEVEKTK